MCLSQAFDRQLASDAKGVIVNLIDQRVWSTRADYLSYGLSKAALWSLTRNLALALAPRIRVVAVGPGYTLPESSGQRDDFLARAAKLPLARPSSPSEVCHAVQFLLAAPSVTGQMIALDGGEHLMPGHPDAR